METSKDEGRALLRAWVSEHGQRPGAAALTDQADLLQEGFIDSLGLMELISYVEEVRGRALADADMRMEHFKSIDHIVGALIGPQAPETSKRLRED
jgi:acyl carrier protein